MGWVNTNGASFVRRSCPLVSYGASIAGPSISEFSYRFAANRPLTENKPCAEPVVQTAIRKAPAGRTHAPWLGAPQKPIALPFTQPMAAVLATTKTGLSEGRQP